MVTRSSRGIRSLPLPSTPPPPPPPPPPHTHTHTLEERSGRWAGGMLDHGPVSR